MASKHVNGIMFFGDLNLDLSLHVGLCAMSMLNSLGIVDVISNVVFV
jgi:hypothetical protein